MSQLYKVLYSGKHHGEKYSRGGVWGVLGDFILTLDWSTEASFK